MEDIFNIKMKFDLKFVFSKNSDLNSPQDSFDGLTYNTSNEKNVCSYFMLNH